jgi:predicted PurR-regulated permease PerM
MTPEKPNQSEAMATRLVVERAAILLLLAALAAGVAQVLAPFTTAILFGGTLALAAWPLRELLVARGWRRGAVAALLLVGSLLLVLLPVLAILPSLSEQVSNGVKLAQEFAATSPPPPAFLAKIPFVGQDLVRGWGKVADTHGDVRAMIAPYAAPLRGFVIAAAQALADSVTQLLLSLIVATMFWASGDSLAGGLRDVLGRLGGDAATRSLDVVAGAVRGVAYGVVGTAIIQGVLMAIGLAAAGVPAAALLGFLTLLFAISQIGAVLMIAVWGGAAWWLYGLDATGWAIFMVAWGCFVGTVDNFIRPWLISFGVELPLALVILGVFGGFLGFGFLGLFIGPALLAVAYTLLEAWRAAGDGTAAPPPA